MNGPQGKQMTPVDPNEKIQLEIEDLRWKVKWFYRITQLFSTVIAIGALALSLHQFNNQQVQEIKKPIREKQLNLVFELSDVASRIAVLKPDDVERKKAETRFRELYWGPSVYIQDDDLRAWMIQFDKCLNELNPNQEYPVEARANTKPDQCTTAAQQDKRLKNLSLDFAIMRRKKLGVEWGVPFEESVEDTTRVQNKPTPLALP
ncbi:MAG TPA: hypothetical protein VJT15_17335 [Pyrinomonadaceae bacterium]|nr:hypothetical protein [Pyrinomonadaceae bacterium]